MLCYALLTAQGHSMGGQVVRTWNALLSFATLCFALLSLALLCSAMLCFATLNFLLLCLALPCFAKLRFAQLCFALLCYALLTEGHSMGGQVARP